MASIISSSPVNGEIEVYIGRNVSVTFDTDMDPAYINSQTFVVYDQDLTILTGVYSYDVPTRTATFNPAEPFLVRHEYQVVILGGPNGVRTILDGWGDYDTLPSNYSFNFITNDGRFLTPPITPLPPSGVPSGIIYPSGYSYSSTFAVLRTYPANRATDLAVPSGFRLDPSGNPTITIIFDKPVDPATLDDITIVGQDVLQDPFVPIVDLTASGNWSTNLWTATFTFDSPTALTTNEEVMLTIPTTVASTDMSTMVDAGESQLYFTTQLDPMYIGANMVRLKLGHLAADIPDDTINRLIYINSLRANWYSRERPPLIKPFWTPMYDPARLLTARPAFIVGQQPDGTFGAPRYVKEYVLAQTMLDLLKARFYGFIDGIMLGGGPGGSKALADLRIQSSSGGMYAATIGPMIDKLEGPMSEEGSVQYWLGYITGNQRWKPGFALKWGPSDIPLRAAFLSGGTGNVGPATTGGGASQRSF